MVLLGTVNGSLSHSNQALLWLLLLLETVPHLAGPLRLNGLQLLSFNLLLTNMLLYLGSLLQLLLNARELFSDSLHFSAHLHLNAIHL
jgi:hypothetical protein